MFSLFHFIKRGLFERGLKYEENGEIYKRGFLVKNYFTFGEFIFMFSVFYPFIGFCYLVFFDYFFLGGLFFPVTNGKEVLNVYLLTGAMFVLIFYLLLFFYLYVFQSKMFYFEGGIYIFGKIYKSTQDIKYFGKYIDFINRLFYGKNLPKTVNIRYGVISGSRHRHIALLLFFGFLILSFSLRRSLLLYILILMSVYLLRQLVEHFHPLYAFGNLGEKIQSLTPQIEQQSKEIQENFKEDINFGVLHSGFEKLSATFSQIVSLVLKLENIEKKANKGNLFDSTKYINSLRSDIITPLTSLKSFLEKQKQELMNSQKELSRVRVGGSDESGNTELASKRSESLMIELEKNIGSLDEMIGKMG